MKAKKILLFVSIIVAVVLFFRTKIVQAEYFIDNSDIPVNEECLWHWGYADAFLIGKQLGWDPTPKWGNQSATKWAPEFAGVNVSVKTQNTTIRFVFSQEEIDFYSSVFTKTNSRIPYALEIDVVDHNSIFGEKGVDDFYIYKENVSEEETSLKIDVSAYDSENQMSVFIPRPDLLKPYKVYEIVLRPNSPKFKTGNVKLNFQLTVNYKWLAFMSNMKSEKCDLLAIIDWVEAIPEEDDVKGNAWERIQCLVAESFGSHIPENAIRGWYYYIVAKTDQYIEISVPASGEAVPICSDDILDPTHDSSGPEFCNYLFNVEPGSRYGDFIKFSNSPKVYYVFDNRLYWVKDTMTFYEMGNDDFSGVIEYDASLYYDKITSQYPIVGDGFIVKVPESNSPEKVYMLKGNQWHWFTSWDVFVSCGFTADDIVDIAPIVFRMYDEGTFISSSDGVIVASGGYSHVLSDSSNYDIGGETNLPPEGGGDTVYSYYYPDMDDDHYGDINGEAVYSSFASNGYKHTSALLATSGDCDDNNPNVYPGAVEICDGVDNDCNGQIDEGFNTVCDGRLWYQDRDGDGYGDNNVEPTESDSPIPGHVQNNIDCDDSNDEINPQRAEIFNNGVDDNCNGVENELIVSSSGTGDFLTVQAAVNGSHGQPIVVEDGTYYENVVFPTNEYIHIVSANGPEFAIIDGGENDSVIKMTGHTMKGCVIEGLTLTNGNASEGGGIRCNGYSAIIQNCRITGNYAGEGGGIAFYNSQPTIQDCIITDNESQNSGGGIRAARSSLTIEDSEITNNQARSFGAGIYLEGCQYSSSMDIPYYSIPSEITETKIDGNEVTFFGGGIYINEAPIKIRNTQITNNISNLLAGAIQAYNTTELTIKIYDTTISNNYAKAAGTNILITAPDYELVNCVTEGNN